MTCEQQQHLMPAYVADALDEAERLEIRAHLASGCAQCTGALVEAQTALALLSMSLPPVAPRAEVRGRILQGLKARPRTEPASAPAPTQLPADVPTPMRIGPPARAAGPSRWWVPAAVAALVVITFGGSYAWIASQRNAHQRIVALQSALADQDTRVEELQSMLGSETLHLAALKGSEPTQPAFGRVLWDKGRKQSHVYIFNLKPPAKGRTYELWLIPKDQKPVPAGTFDVDANGRAVVILPAPALEQVALAAITEEPVGGSPQPTSAVQLSGEVR